MCHPCGFTGFGKDPLTHGSAALHPGPGCFIPAGWASIDSMNSNVSPLRGFRFRLYPWTQGSAALHSGLSCSIPAGWASDDRGYVMMRTGKSSPAGAVQFSPGCSAAKPWDKWDHMTMKKDKSPAGAIQFSPGCSAAKPWDKWDHMTMKKDKSPAGAVQFSPGCSAAKPWDHKAMKKKKSPAGATP